MKRIFICMLAATASLSALAGGKGGDALNIPYYLPETVLHIEVTAEMETVHAGQYAKYAQKYLGVNVPQKSAGKCRVTGVTVTSGVGADRSAKYQISAEGLVEAEKFMKFTKEGVAVLWGAGREGSGDGKAEMAVPAAGEATMDAAVNVSLPQSVLKAKTEEQKAYELASAIFALRTTRMNIITGNTDATYSGSAMQAAFDEIGMLEKEYMSLFAGYTQRTVQKMTFDIIPNVEETEMVAFRISDVDGLLPAEESAGRAVSLRIVPREMAQGQKFVIGKNDKSEYVFYRVPATCTLRLSDGNTILFTGRQDIYQFGTQAAMPVQKSKK